MDGSVNPGDAARMTQELLNEAENGVNGGEGSTPPDPPAGNNEPPASGQKPPAGGVKAGTKGAAGEEVTPPTSTEPPPAEPGNPPTEEKTVPYNRFQEVIRDRDAARESTRRLEDRVDNLTGLLTQVATRDSSATKKETKEITKSLDDVVKELDLDPQEARNLETVVTTILQKQGVAESVKVKQLEDTVKQLQQQQQTKATQDFLAQDKAEKAETLKKYNGVVTAEEFDEVLEVLRKSNNQRDKEEYDHSSYESIIRNHFNDKIVQHAVDQALEHKKGNPPPPPVEPGSGGRGNQPKKPEPPDDLIEPGKGGVGEALSQQMLAEIAKPGE